MLLAQMHPDRIGIEHAANDRRIAPSGTFCNRASAITVGRKARSICRARKRVSHHLPPVDAVHRLLANRAMTSRLN
jgi:hypothetical protein